MKNILIIGATSEIAQQCAKIWNASGNNLFLVARNKKKLKNIKKKLMKKNNIIGIFYSDLSRIDNHSAILDKAEKKMGDIDIVLIAHGTLSNQKKCEYSVKLTLSEIKNNSLSTISLLTHLANRFEINRKGTIAVISSVAADRGRSSNYIYASTKAMIVTFLSGLRQRLYKSKVNVITIKLGLVKTPMTKKLKKNFFWVEPHGVAAKIIKAIHCNKNEVYIPSFWWLIMFVIKMIPNSLFRKINL